MQGRVQRSGQPSFRPPRGIAAPFCQISPRRAVPGTRLWASKAPSSSHRDRNYLLHSRDTTRRRCIANALSQEGRGSTRPVAARPHHLLCGPDLFAPPEPCPPVRLSTLCDPIHIEISASAHKRRLAMLCVHALPRPKKCCSDVTNADRTKQGHVQSAGPRGLSWS
jgi:hypothetical protein